MAGLTSRKFQVFLVISCVLIAAINGAFFAEVYWLNADDVMFLQSSLEGFDAVVEAVKLYSTAQGRFGQTILMPMNILAAYLSQFVLFRIFAVGLFFGSIWTFLLWFDSVLRTNVRAIAFLLCAGLSVLHYYHLPPTSFPLQNTVPYLLLVLSRLAILRSRSLGSPLAMLWAVPLFSLTMSLSEYALLFGTGMLAVEYLAVLCREPRWSTIREVLRSRQLYVDLSACVLPLLIYLGWRMIFPSAYDGNSLDGFSDLGLAFRVWLLHTFGLNGLAIPQGWSVFGTNWERLVPPLATAIAVFVAVFAAIPRLEIGRRPLVPAVLALLFAMYVTFLPSMTLKQQQWCAEAGACVFLDSRTAFPATILAMVFIGAGLWQATNNRRIASAVIRSALSLFAAFATALTLAHNAWMTDHMDHRMAVWRSAETLGCTIEREQAGLRDMIDPQGIIAIHPHLDADNFWRIYLAQTSKGC